MDDEEMDGTAEAIAIELKMCYEVMRNRRMLSGVRTGIALGDLHDMMDELSTAVDAFERSVR